MAIPHKFLRGKKPPSAKTMPKKREHSPSVYPIGCAPDTYFFFVPSGWQ